MGIFNILKKDPFIELEQSVKGLGNSKYPFLHPSYNPMSRIPCTDFSLWVRDRLQKRDYKNINRLFYEIIKENPGIGTSFGGSTNSNYLGENWERKLYKIYNTDFSQIITYDDDVAYWDLQTVLILDLPHSDKNRMNYIVSCMSPHIPCEIQGVHSSVVSSVSKILSRLPINSRSHFFDICNLHTAKDGRSMPFEKSSYYSTRQHGISLSISTDKLISSGLVYIDNSLESRLKQYTKDDLISFGANRALTLSPSWNKEKIISTILEIDPDGAKKLAEKFQLIYPSQLSLKYQEEFRELIPALLQIYGRVIPYVT